MKKYAIFFLPVISASLFMMGCEEDIQNDNAQAQSDVTVVARTDEASEPESAATRSTEAAAEGTVITDAKISIKEFELEVLNLSAALNLLSELEIELKEPRVVTLVSEGQAQSEVIAEGKLQNGLYSEAEFSYHKNLSVETSDEMYGKSILVKGQHNGLPFVCWTDEEKDVEIDFEGEGIDVKEQGAIYVTFYVNKVMNEIDLSLAVDGNANGVIEIGPDGADGNAALYAAMQAGLTGMAKL
ncbi:hypothetical protein EDD80_10130 [Anseongella ginsenosidimutans]|uniref:Lipoprotein n=1 Tax=Anseongella ginsenosidimutans TaxID=496056 RepID=A0A4V2UU96_9SPHI|nr:hypothetical protein [Anseongella ginsenosidimutans]QEC51458.1 hypothetical protein FRZ59_03215 [Anseongella ginsenosidimutans]TCS89833.1 hypothetical protein EDD80_10130 [Anseongella ginsenosidimutans]